MNTSIGKVIADLRQARDWSQQDLANRAGVSKTTVWNVENTNTAQQSTIEKIAAALHIEVTEIYHRVNPPSTIAERLYDNPLLSRLEIALSDVPAAQQLTVVEIFERVCKLVS